MMNSQPLDSFAKALYALLAGEKIPLSTVSGTTQKRLQPAIDAGAVQVRRSGGGNVMLCSNPVILQSFANNNYPNGLLAAPLVEHGARTGALARFRDTKAEGGLDFELAHIRVFDDAALSIEGESVHAAKQTQRLGCVSSVLGGAFEPQLSGRVALVEGPELFMRYDWIADDVAAVVHYAGRISDRMLDWLQRCHAITVVLHFADYDPVGLCEYLRVKGRLAEKVFPHAPSMIDKLFYQYSKSTLLQKNAALMPRLVNSNDPYVQRIVALMQAYGAGLEQEALLLTSREDDPRS